ncbi:MAG: KTSC domain-containing protein [Acidobacteriaceae bacterium]|nr:KTSC domain-containing protein [Acidobacteriaceae bacterium]
MQRLRSKLIDGFTYDEDTKKLTLWMANGQRRVFVDVPYYVADDLQASSSPGSYYKKLIKRKFPAAQ